MRHVDIRSIELPLSWERRAATAKATVASLNPTERSRAINQLSRIWADLKSLLGALSDKKCWYCESIQVRSDKQVDHFRPKNAVDEPDCTDHPGYWWLAFEWRNYRYSCTLCNSPRTDPATGTTGGKGARFPVRDERRRCFTDEDLLEDEQPILLDPTDPADPALLWFDEDGTAQPSHDCRAAPWPHRRAKESISIYHLNHEDIKEARRAVCNDCKRLVDEGDAAWQSYATSGSSTNYERFKTVCGLLAKRLSCSSEYSTSARSTLKGLRSSGRVWLDTVLDAA